MPGRYAQLPTRLSESNPELDVAFGPDDDDDGNGDGDEFNGHLRSNPPVAPSGAVGAGEGERGGGPAPYDFERDYDYARPPPGSPPSTAVASSATRSPGGGPSTFTLTRPSSVPRPSFWRRAAGALLPARFTQLPTTAHPAVLGGGTENDGVFSNVTAKPSACASTDSQRAPYILPEEEQAVGPPSYAAAQADAVPSYLEAIVHVPSGLDAALGMIIDDLPTGSWLAFLANMFTSFFFQFVGFLLTYLLHTTHAAKLGSRAGLGLTLIQYGFYSRMGEDPLGAPAPEDAPGDQFMDTPYPSTQPADGPPVEDNFFNITSRDWLSFLLMTLGWFILLSSLIGFWRVKHWESSIRASSAQGPPTPGEISREIASRGEFEQVFGYPPENTHDPLSGTAFITQPLELAESRLRHDLRVAGLL